MGLVLVAVSRDAPAERVTSRPRGAEHFARASPGASGPGAPALSITRLPVPSAPALTRPGSPLTPLEAPRGREVTRSAGASRLTATGSRLTPAARSGPAPSTASPPARGQPGDELAAIEGRGHGGLPVGWRFLGPWL